MRLIEIVRVSRTGLRDERLRSPDWQGEQNHAWAKANGHTIIGTIEEIDVSGGTTNRKALSEAKRAVLAGEADGLVASYLSRFSRNTAEGLILVRDVLGAGREFFALDCPFDLRSPEGQQLLTYRLAEAQYERDRATRNFQRGRKGAIARGVHLTECFGYVKGDDGRLAPHPTEAVWVPKIFARRAGGASWHQIADWLNDAGISPHVYSDRRDGSPVRRKAGDKWRHNTVKGLIENRTYLGEARSGEFVNPLAHPPLVDLGVFKACEAMRDLRPRRGRAEYELGGVVRCAHCGRKMAGNGTTKGGRLYRSYRCSPNSCDVRGKAKADDVEAFAQAELAAIVAGGRVEESESTVDLDAAIAALKAAETGRDQAADDIDLQATSRVAYLRSIRQWESRVDAAREAVTDARASVVGVRADQGDIDDWSALPIDIRRRIIGEAFDAIWVGADRRTFAAARRGELADATARVALPVA